MHAMSEISKQLSDEKSLQIEESSSIKKVLNNVE